jgi:hypothetical protein
VPNGLTDIARVAELLRFSTSIKIVQDYLRGRNLPFSAAGWEELIAKRIIQPVNDGKLDVVDFLKLLSSVEECGRQHVFLYECSPDNAHKLMTEDRLQNALAVRGLSDLKENPLVLDTPESAMIVDVRLESADVPLSLTVKEVYSHEAFKQTSTTRNGNKMVKTWDIVKTRAVNVAKLHRDGLLEIRLASVSESSYQEQRERFIRQLGDILPVHQFEVLSFTKAKIKLSDEKDVLAAKIRFTDTILRNDNGTTVKVATGSHSDDLANDQGARAGEDAFLGHNGAYADGHNFFIRAVPGLLSKEILILMSGESNEFGVMANCDETNYNYVLSELRSLNQ